MLYLIDTNILLYYIHNQLPIGAPMRLEQMMQGDWCLSEVSVKELLQGVTPTEATTLHRLIDSATVLEVDEQVKAVAQQIRSYQKKLAIADALIAATALVNGLVLVTRNGKDFVGIQGLELLDLWE